VVFLAACHELLGDLCYEEMTW